MARKAKGTGTIKKRTVTRNNKEYTFWEGQITIGTDPGTGKQKRRTFTGSTQKEVRERMQAAAVAVNENDFFEPGKITLKQWIETWLSEYCSAIKPLTRQQYRSMSETHIFPALGAVQLSKLSSPQLQKFYNQLAIDGKTIKRKNAKTGKVESVKCNEPLSAKSIKNIHGILSKALNVAVDQGLIRSNAAERTILPKIVKKEILPLTEEQQKAFLAALENHEYRFIFTVILFTGLREAEAVGLSWDCIDWKKGTLKVYRQLQRIPGNWGTYRFVPLKNSKPRTIKLSPYIISILTSQRAKQSEERFAAGDAWQGYIDEEERKTALIFTNKIGTNFNSVTLYGNFKRIAAGIGAPEARLHDLRHTFAVNSLQCGDDVKTVQDALGHATAAFTLDQYAHVSERMAEEHARRQQEYIKSLLA